MFVVLYAHWPYDLPAQCNPSSLNPRTDSLPPMRQIAGDRELEIETLVIIAVTHSAIRRFLELEEATSGPRCMPFRTGNCVLL